MTNHEPGAGFPSVPPAYAEPQQPFTSSAPTPTPRPPRNTLALVALIVAIAGFIFACIPGALIVGWILLPIAFVLAIVSLFMKGTGKGRGIAALIISVVGTIIGFVVFFAVVTSSVSNALSDGPTIVEGPASTGQAPAESAPADAPADSGAAASTDATGTRDNPVAIGSTISSDTWSVKVNAYNADGAADVEAGNSFNDPAPAGSHYEIVNYTTTYIGKDSAYAVEVGMSLVTSGGNVINSYDNFTVLKDSIGLDELFTGASTTGSVAFTVPDGQSVLIRVRPGVLADEVFVTP